MAMKKATRERRVQDFERGYQAGYADGKRAAQLQVDSEEAASATFEAMLGTDADVTPTGTDDDDDDAGA